METLTLTDYYAQLEAHDWYYEYTEDARVWKNGREQRDALIEGTKAGAEFADLYNAYYNYIFNDEAKPAKPE